MDKDIISAIKALEKKHGKGVIMDLEDENSIKGVEFESTGIFSLDTILGGGLPKGRMIEMYGMESSGKTTLAIHIASEFQKRGLQVGYIDVENAFDPIYAKKLGLNVKDLIFSQPDWGEQALDIIDALVKAKVNLIIVDSVANLVPKCELDGEAGDAVVGKVARLMSQAVRRLSGPVSEHGAILLFINQLRQKIGITWGDPNVTPGGMALKFGSSIRLELKKMTKLKDSDKKSFGITILAKTVKNKVASPFQECAFEIIFGEGISVASDILEIGVREGIIDLQGKRSYIYNGKDLGAGKKGALETLRNDKELNAEIMAKIKEKYNS